MDAVGLNVFGAEKVTWEKTLYQFKLQSLMLVNMILTTIN